MSSIYKLRRKSDNKFFGGSLAKRNEDKHDSHGRFYTTEFTAVRALHTAGLNPKEYHLVEYKISIKSVKEASKVNIITPSGY